MNEYKTFDELKKEFGEDYDYKFYQMGLSAVKEIERLNNIINKAIEYINDLKTQVDSKTYDILEYEKIDLLEILKGE